MTIKEHLDCIVEKYEDGDEIFGFFTMSYNNHSTVSVEEIFIHEIKTIIHNNYDLGNKGLYGMKRYIKFELFKKGVDF